MKKQILSTVSLLLAMTSLTGCTNTSTSTHTDSINIVTNIFPIYDWTRQIVGDTEDIDITLLMDNGTDLHSFQPSFDDIKEIADSDLFIYIVGPQDTWASDAVAQATNTNQIDLNLVEILGDSIYEEEIVEGMEEEDEEEEEGAYDEHVWLSLKRAITMVEAIRDSLCEIDPDNSETYQTNASNYIAQLSQLDDSYQQVVDTASYDTLLFADLFPFLYMTKDYGLHYYAAFAGCSEDTNASFETIVFLANKVDELGLTTVLTIDGNTTNLAQSVINITTDQSAINLELNSMQTTTRTDIDNGVTYLSIMESNLDVLTQALNK